MMSISKFKYLLLFILLIGTEGVYGQLSTNDSLMMKALSDSVNRYSFTEPDKALSFVEKKRMYSKSYTNKDHYLRTYIQEMNVNFLSNRLVNLSDNFKAFEAVFANYGQKCTKGEDLLYEFDNLKSLYYFLLHDFKQAKLLINDGLSKFESKQKRSNEDYGKIYLLRLKNSEVNLHNGNFSAAIQDVESALTTLEKLKKTSSMLKLNLFVQLASVYGKAGKRKEADYYYTQSAKILDSIKNNKTYNLQAISFYLSLAKSNILIQNFKKGTYCLKQISKLVDKNENQQKNVFRQLGLIKSKERNYSEALFLFKKARHISTKIYSSRHHESAQIDYELAQIYEKQNNPTKALAQTQAALIALSQQFNSKNYQDNPKIKDVFSKKDLLETLDFKAGLLLYMAKPMSDVGRDAINRVSVAPIQGRDAINRVSTAYQTASLAAALIDTIRADYTSDFDKQYLADWSYGVYEKNIETAFQLFQKTGNKIINVPLSLRDLSYR